MWLLLTRTNRSGMNLIQNWRIYIRAASLSLVFFRQLSALGRGRLISYIIIYLLRSTLYDIVFSPVCCGLEFLFLEVKYDIFGYGNEETWQKHPDKYSQHKIVDPNLSSMSSTSCSRKNTHTHIHTHTRTHTHTHTHTHTSNKFHRYYSWWLELQYFKSVWK